MKHILITTIAAVVLVGCGPSEADRELFDAASDGNIEGVRKHLEAGANVNATSKNGFTPLDIAILIERRDKRDNEISDLLRSKGAKSGTGTSLLVAASLGDVQSIKKLLTAGTDINKPTRHIEPIGGRGGTLLHVTASHGHKNATELLLVSGANINAIDDQGRTPLFKAVRNRKKEIVELLIAKGADINTDTGLHTLAWAYSYPDWSEEEQKREEVRRSEKVEMARFLISKGVDVNWKNNTGYNALHAAAQSGHEEMATFLIESGANINESNKGNQTPLHNAAFDGRDKIVNILIQNGANVNPVIQSAGSFNGMTPVDLALEKNRIGTVSLLRKHGGKTGDELKSEGK